MNSSEHDFNKIYPVAAKYFVSDRVTVSCPASYALSAANPTAVCLHDSTEPGGVSGGSWSQYPPKCVKVIIKVEILY